MKFIAALLVAAAALLAPLPSFAHAADTFESLGQPCKAFNVLASRVVKDPAGKEWFVLTNANEATGMELIFIDPAANTARTFRAPAGQGAWMLNPVPGDRLVVGTYYDGHMLVFDLKSMAFTKAIPFPGEQYVWNGAIGADGRVYGGTYPGGKLGALDLDTLKLEDLGAPAKPNLYLRHVSPTPDGRLLCNFIATAPTTKLFDPTAKVWSDVPASIAHVQRAVVWNGHLLAIGERADKPVAFKGADLQPVDPPPFPVPDGGGWSIDGNLTTATTVYFRRGNALWRHDPSAPAERQLEKVFDDDLQGGHITAATSDGTLLGVRGQSYLVAAPGKTTAERRPIPAEGSPRPMHFIKADDRGRLWGGPIFGQTLFHMDLATKQVVNTDIVCNSGGEVYDVAFAPDGKTYAVSYAGGHVVEYDPAKPWDQLANENPRAIARMSDHGYIRPVAGIHRAADDGRLYSGWMAGYGRYGGALAVTDPATRETTVVKDPLGPQAVSSLYVDHRSIFLGTSLRGNGLRAQENARPQFGVLDRATLKPVFQQPLGKQTINRILNDRKHNQLVVVVDGRATLFDLATRTFKDPAPALAKLSVSESAIDTRGDGVLVLGVGRRLITHDLATGASRESQAPDKIDDLCVAPDGTVFIACGATVYRVPGH